MGVGGGNLQNGDGSCKKIKTNNACDLTMPIGFLGMPLNIVSGFLNPQDQSRLKITTSNLTSMDGPLRARPEMHARYSRVQAQPIRPDAPPVGIDLQDINGFELPLSAIDLQDGFE